MKKFYWIVFLVSVFAIKTGAQPFSLFMDINPGPDPGANSGFMKTDAGYFFQGSDATHGFELWKTDGTAASTVMIKDINPGVNNSDITFIKNTGTIHFFWANDGTHGIELWKTDGTLSGTVMIKDINPDVYGYTSYGTELINGILFFIASDGIHGQEIWKTDGTSSGTVMIKDIGPGANSAIPVIMGIINGKLLFAHDDGVNGKELWKTDGTEAGTLLVKDINPGINGSIQNGFIIINGLIYFAANDGTHGYELCKTDGTEGGTVMIKDITPGINSYGPNRFVNVNGVLFFSANDGVHGDELWKSDGTEVGTVMIKDVNPGPSSAILESAGLVNFNGVVFFAAKDVIHGIEIWRSNGTEAGTILVKDINPGENGSIRGGTGPRFAVIDDQLFFMAKDALHGFEAWRSDGTEAGTVMIQDIIPGTGGSDPGAFIDVYGKIFFLAYTPDYGLEWWSGNINVPLPFTLSDFKGQLSGNDGLLNWKTSSEQNTLHFEIERSTDGRFFTKAGTVTAAGNSSAAKQYNYTDRNITSSGALVVYYRLKVMDADGRFTYSEIIAININSREAVIMLYPNPVRENTTLMISATKKENITYSIIDQTGRMIRRKNTTINEGSNIITVEANSLAAGVYTIELNGISTKSRVKFVKQ